jgi:endonuclease III
MLKNNTLEQRLTEAEASAVCNVLVTRLGGSYSRLLGIELAGMEPDESFKWLAAAILLGSPVRAVTALSAYRLLESLGILEPGRLAAIDEQLLFAHLRSAGVTAYTRRVASMLKAAAGSIVADYDGDINRLHFFAEDAGDLENRVRQLGGRLPRRAVNLFLREMRGVWDKAHPGLSRVAVEAAFYLGLVRGTDPEEASDELRANWECCTHAGRAYADLEVALARLGENYCDIRRCISCPMAKLCVGRHSGEEAMK